MRFDGWIKGVCASLLSVIYPERCRLCDVELAPHEKWVCSGCLDGLTVTNYDNDLNNMMACRFIGLIPLVEATGYFFYQHESGISTLIKDFKYHGKPLLARELGRYAAERLFMRGFFSAVDVMMPIPIHFTKRMRRGYNQTEYLAEGVRDATGLPVSLDLVATRAHKTQTSKNREERMAQDEGIFTLRHGEKYTGMHVLLIDDVCTTGSTLLSAAKAIVKAAPNVKISIFTLAVTESGI
jgi:ComF family protein